MKYGLGGTGKNECAGKGPGKYLRMLPFVGALFLNGCYMIEDPLPKAIFGHFDDNDITDGVWVEETPSGFLTPPDTVRVMLSMNGGEPKKLLERYGKWGYLEKSSKGIKLVLKDVQRTEKERLNLRKIDAAGKR